MSHCAEEIEEIATGLPELDQDHVVQLDLFELLLEQLLAADLVGVSETSARLSALTEQHFRNEELLMRFKRYPAYREHREEHRQMTEQLDRIRSGELGPAQALTHVDGLRRWFETHVRGPDRMLARYLAVSRSSAA
jgi:hemerythrin-like metal-binding protein